MSNVEEEVESQLIPQPKPKRKTLSTAERLRIIDDFRNGIPDKYYSVDLNPRKPGEYIVRKRKTPITYEIERRTLSSSANAGPVERKRTVKPEPEPEDDAPTSKTPSQLLTEPKKAFVGSGTALNPLGLNPLGLNPLAGTEFFSMQSSLNANLQRELDTLHEKFNKLDAKFRKERAARKAKNQEPNQPAPSTQAVRRRKPAPKPKPEPEPQESDSHEYEYEYVDEQPAEQEQQPRTLSSPTGNVNPFGLRTRPAIDIRDF